MAKQCQRNVSLLGPNIKLLINLSQGTALLTEVACSAGKRDDLTLSIHMPCIVWHWPFQMTRTPVNILFESCCGLLNSLSEIAFERGLA
jgi:uncharacterized membrane protein YczE